MVVRSGTAQDRAELSVAGGKRRYLFPDLEFALAGWQSQFAFKLQIIRNVGIQFIK